LSFSSSWRCCYYRDARYSKTAIQHVTSAGFFAGEFGGGVALFADLANTTRLGETKRAGCINQACKVSLGWT
jgi:hypothetical protein